VKADDPSLGKVERAEGLAELAATLVFGGEIDEAGPLIDEALTTLEEAEAWSASGQYSSATRSIA